jgi:transcriptional regulator
MYLPAHFAETDAAEIAAILADAPLAALVAATPDGLVANHIPLLADGPDVLIGHVARANDLHRLVPDGADVMAIFRRDDAYITPNSYPTKADHHRHVPTWNYQAVHVHGAITFQHDERAKRKAVGLLTAWHERRLNGAAAWRMADAPADYMATMLSNVVAFRIDVTRVIAKSKLSQNREAIDHQGAVDTLIARGEVGLAAAMVARRPRPPTNKT